MFKPLMHSFHRTATILKLTDKQKGPSGVRNETPALIKQYHNSQWNGSDSQPKMCGTKKKSLSKQIDFFTDYKHYQKSESEGLPKILGRTLVS